jgi:hypothetical protein
LDTGHVPCYVELLNKIRRPNGAPRKTLTLNEGFCPFYSISRSQTAIDRLLLALSSGNYPDAYADVCAGRRTTREAAIEAGILSPGSAQPKTPDVEKFKRSSPKSQGKILVHLFRAAAVEGQCFFIASELQPALGMELAQEWRQQHQHNGNVS